MGDETEQLSSHFSFSISKTRLFSLLGLFLILFALPLVILAAPTVQNTQQHASEKDTITLPGGSTLLFTVHVSGLTTGYPAVFYIATKDTSNRERGDEGNQIYKTDKNGTILLKVNPNDQLVIKPLLSKGYKHITPETMNINVLKSTCGVSAPCTFMATQEDSLPPISGTPTLHPSCTPRPACLDAHPGCLIAEPIDTDWCKKDNGDKTTPTISVSPTPTMAPKKCPELPTTCIYTGSGLCRVHDDHPSSCSCGEIVCTGL